MSGLARRDIDEVELNALSQLLGGFHPEPVEFFASDKVREEIDRVPAQYRQVHLDVLELFKCLGKVNPGPRTMLSPLVLPMTNPRRQTWDRLNQLLPDSSDCEHLMSAQYNRLSHFLTVDYTTILKHRNEFQKIAGLVALRPSELVDHLLEGEA